VAKVATIIASRQREGSFIEAGSKGGDKQAAPI